MLGLGNKLGSGIVTPGIVTSNLVMKHMYPAGAVQPVSDGAASFDGTTSNNSITTTLAGNTAFQNDFTMSAWIRRSATDEFQKIIQATDSTDDRVELYIQQSSVGSDLILTFGPSTGASANKYCHAVTAWTGNYNGIWTHVAATYKAGEQKIYINGVDDTDTGSHNTITDSVVNLTATVVIGSLFSGYICNAGIWSRVLTQAEIKSIMWKQYADLSTNEKTNITAWWNLDAQVGSDGNAGAGYILDENAGAGSTTNLGTL